MRISKSVQRLRVFSKTGRIINYYATMYIKILSLMINAWFGNQVNVNWSHLRENYTAQVVQIARFVFDMLWYECVFNGTDRLLSFVDKPLVETVDWMSWFKTLIHHDWIAKFPADHFLSLQTFELMTLLLIKLL